MHLRDALGSLQLPVAGLGILLMTGALHSLLTMPPPPPQSDGFLQGFAVFFLALLCLTGFIITAFGLAIPIGNGVGIRFNRKQRWLFVVAGGAGIGSVALPVLVYLGIVAFVNGTSIAWLVNVWFGTCLVAVASFTTATVWRVSEAVLWHLRSIAEGRD